MMTYSFALIMIIRESNINNKSNLRQWWTNLLEVNMQLYQLHLVLRKDRIHSPKIHLLSRINQVILLRSVTIFQECRNTNLMYPNQCNIKNKRLQAWSTKDLIEKIILVNLAKWVVEGIPMLNNYTHHHHILMLQIKFYPHQEMRRWHLTV